MDNISLLIIPLLIDFVTPSSIFQEENRVSTLRIIGNGPAGTFVVFPHGLRVSLPTDQIVCADDSGGHARVGFGGMRFVGSEEGHPRVRQDSRADCPRISSPPPEATPCASIRNGSLQYWQTGVLCGRLACRDEDRSWSGSSWDRSCRSVVARFLNRTFATSQRRCLLCAHCWNWLR